MAFPIKACILSFCCIFLPSLLPAQKYTISGYIEDASSGEKLMAANILDLNKSAGTVSNTYGFYSLTLPTDSVYLSVSYIGYQSRQIALFLDRDLTLNLLLEPSVSLSTVEVVAEKFDRIEEQTQMSRVMIPIDQVKKVPALLGEADVLKTLQLLPGVQSGGEGQTGLYVRGGSPDQNLVMLDGVPVYNVSHVLGIFSVFNADALKNVSLTKGGFPARYGGRLSSILELNMKEGNLQQFHGQGSLGLISSKLALEGPLIKEKSSFIVSARRTYADLIFRPIVRNSQRRTNTEIDPVLYFYDLNAKINYKLNDHHRLYLSFYGGADVFKNKVSESDGFFDGGVNWGNTISALRWNYQISNKLFANTTLTYSDYEVDILASQVMELEQERSSFSAKYGSGIQDIAGKIDLDFIPAPDHYIKFGLSATHHVYTPGAIAIASEFNEFSLDTLIGNPRTESMEYALYLEDDIRLGALRANLGIHTSAFQVEESHYFSVQPRIGLRYLLNNGLALKASFSTMAQYINLLTSESLSFPTDLWVPSTDKIRPQRSWQIATGLARHLFDQYEVSLEGYYKRMHDVLSFREGASFFLGLEGDWQEKVTQGEGKSYGLELLFQKKSGKWTGWLGYTLSWNTRLFEDINAGKVFPFRYDRRHDLSLVMSYQFNDQLTASASWVYGSGNAITLPLYRLQDSPPQYFRSGPLEFGPFFNEVEGLGQKNAYRMSDYHRLDLSLQWGKKKKRWEWSWVFSIYNAYYHRNPYYLIVDTDEFTDVNGSTRTERVFKEISILPIIPSISFQFEF